MAGPTLSAPRLAGAAAEPAEDPRFEAKRRALAALHLVLRSPRGARELARLAPAADERSLMLRPPASGRCFASIDTPAGPVVIRLAGAGGGLLEAVPLAEDPNLPGARLPDRVDVLDRHLRPLGMSVRSLRVERYRPSRRAVCRLICDTAAGPVELFLKLFRRSDYRRVRRIARRLPAQSGIVDLVKPIVWIDDWTASVTAKTPGELLIRAVGDGEPPAAADLAQMLADLRRIDGWKGIRRQTWEGEIAHTTRRLVLYSEIFPPLADLAGRLVAESRLPEPEQVFLHGDLHPGQIFADHRRLSLIDLDGVRLGHRWYDAINLGEQIWLRGVELRHRRRVLNDLRSALYQALSIDLRDPAFRYLAALRRARLAAVWVRRPHCAATTAAIAEGALELLAEEV